MKETSWLCQFFHPLQHAEEIVLWCLVGLVFSAPLCHKKVIIFNVGLKEAFFFLLPFPIDSAAGGIFALFYE